MAEPAEEHAGEPITYLAHTAMLRRIDRGTNLTDESPTDPSHPSHRHLLTTASRT
ncbi:hypothetical protein [Halalkalicoccus paucihalophilus]|uniref:hypothetical protein n=1 Tax=Halalkalicoccus paucihalophilus TaxID=1008153 RepID=UPI000AE9D470|nr:hypothetical protein [Halalkalicoccus paucihalophilus]